MTGVAAAYFDGRTSQAREVFLWFGDDGSLEVTGEGVSLRFSAGEVRVESRLGNTVRCIRLPKGARCETLDNDSIDRVLKSRSVAPVAGWVHRLESSWRLAIVAIIVLAGVGWLAFRYGIPVAARHVAFMVPAALNERLGRDALEMLDRLVFDPSTLSSGRQEDIQTQFVAFLAAQGDGNNYRLEFRSSPEVGPNAFALPSGTIVMTDELVELAEDDREILGVLAHECGHIAERHTLRMVLQNSVIVVAFTLVSGDVSTISAIGGSIPVFLLETRFSRLFEAAADDYAVRAMEAGGLEPHYLATMLERMAVQSIEGEFEYLSYISSHPATKDRIAAITGDNSGEINDASRVDQAREQSESHP